MEQKGVFFKSKSMNSKSKKFKQENEFFLQPRTHKIKYNEKCTNCECDCKQSYKTKIISCEKYKKMDLPTPKKSKSKKHITK